MSVLPNARRRIPDRRHRGLSNSVQFAVVMPLLMLISLGIIQGGVWLHGRTVAAEAANTAADVARNYGGDQSEARRAAARIAELGGLREVSVDIASTPASVQVTLTAEAPLIFDIGLGRISESASAPRERISTP